MTDGLRGHSWPRRLVAVVAAYLLGSVPVVYLLGRSRGVDLRRFGSGNVGSHNLTAAGGPGLGIAGWLADAGKGLIAVSVTRRLTGDPAAAGFALVGALCGQCWPPLLRWQGGRGVATWVGGLLTLDPADAPLCLALLAAVASLHPLHRHVRPSGVGPARPGKAVPIAVLLGVLAWPVVSNLRRRSPVVTVAALAAAATLCGRRITAGGPAPTGRLWSTALIRLLLDRDVVSPASSAKYYTPTLE